MKPIRITAPGVMTFDSRGTLLHGWTFDVGGQVLPDDQRAVARACLRASLLYIAERSGISLAPITVEPEPFDANAERAVLDAIAVARWRE